MLGLLVDTSSCLHLYVNGMDQGVAAQDVPSPCYPFIDLYGQCEQVRKRRGERPRQRQNCVLWQVTIATNHLPAVGGDGGEARCQGDMEKADMVDGEEAAALGGESAGSGADLEPSFQESRRACAGLLLLRSTPTRSASTRRCARASRTCSPCQVRPRPPHSSASVPSALPPPVLF